MLDFIDGDHAIGSRCYSGRMYTTSFILVPSGSTYQLDNLEAVLNIGKKLVCL